MGSVWISAEPYGPTCDLPRLRPHNVTNKLKHKNIRVVQKS